VERVTRAVEAFGTLDSLINNAGVFPEIAQSLLMTKYALPIG
jgi:NAD(P)-dependent dehydrogenase (short-subunit alcohol dehydrogenase family)